MAINKKTRKRNGRTETFYIVTASGIDKSGKRIQRKRHARNKATAIDIEKKLYQEIEEIKRNGKSISFAECLPQYLDYAANQSKKSKGTVASEKSSLENHALPFLGKMKLSDIQYFHIEHVINERLVGKSSQTKSHCLKYLSNLFKFALKKRYCTENPCKQVERIKIIRKPKVILNYEQLVKLIDTTERYFPEWLLHIMFACHLGLRAGEARGLQWGDIDWNTKTIFLSRTFNVKEGVSDLKTHECRTVPLTPELIEKLTSIKNQTSPGECEWVLERHSEFMHSDQAKVVRDICQVAEIPQSTYHQLRAAAITNILRSGLPIGTAMKIVGHKRLSSTNIYYDHSGEEVKGKLDHILFGGNNEE